MIISRTPYRISLFGGGTDYPHWYREHGGAVLTTTIDKYCYLSARRMPPFFGQRYRVMWAKAEAVDRVEDIQHGGVRGCLQYLGWDDAFEVNHAGDLPARSGLGSSSAFTVGMLQVLHRLRGEKVSPSQLAREAMSVEQTTLKETVGIQDQIQCAYGGLNVIRIDQTGSYGIYPIELTKDRLEEFQSHLMLFFTGRQRNASEIAHAQVDNSKRNSQTLSVIMSLVEEGRSLLTGNESLIHLGRLLHRSWTMKKGLAGPISSPELDNIYDMAIGAGAWGGKLLGAGGGGFFLFLAPPERMSLIEEALKPLIRVPFSFDNSGSTTIYETH